MTMQYPSPLKPYRYMHFLENWLMANNPPEDSIRAKSQYNDDFRMHTLISIHNKEITNKQNRIIEDPLHYEADPYKIYDDLEFSKDKLPLAYKEFLDIIYHYRFSLNYMNNKIDLTPGKSEIFSTFHKIAEIKEGINSSKQKGKVIKCKLVAPNLDWDDPKQVEQFIDGHSENIEVIPFTGEEYIFGIDKSDRMYGFYLNQSDDPPVFILCADLNSIRVFNSFSEFVIQLLQEKDENFTKPSILKYMDFLRTLLFEGRSNDVFSIKGCSWEEIHYLERMYHKDFQFPLAYKEFLSIYSALGNKQSFFDLDTGLSFDEGDRGVAGQFLNKSLIVIGQSRARDWYMAIPFDNDNPSVHQGFWIQGEAIRHEHFTDCVLESLTKDHRSSIYFPTWDVL